MQLLDTVQLAVVVLLCFASTVLAADEGQTQAPIKSAAPQLAYKVGDAIPVSCLNRSIETGEHITDEHNQLQYIPFPTCDETKRPLELYFGIERDINCTIEFITDSFFHLLEFYVHNDAPLTCRIPSRPLPLTPRPTSPASTTLSLDAEDASATSGYIPLIIALTGILQLSHLHVSNNLNILLHASPHSLAPGLIDAATAYSISTTTRNTKIVIGDSLPLKFSVRWYPTTSLPSGWTGVGGHLYLSTVLYCLLSAGAATAVCVAYFRGVDLPKRLRSHGRERTFTTGANRVYGGYGYGVGGGNGYGYTGPSTGKFD